MHGQKKKSIFAFSETKKDLTTLEMIVGFTHVKEIQIRDKYSKRLSTSSSFPICRAWEFELPG
jgi:hypothetical protein